MQTKRPRVYPFLVLLIVSLSCAFPFDNPASTPVPDLRLTATFLSNSAAPTENALPEVDATPSEVAQPEIDEQFAEVDPYVDISATATDIVVGETLTVTGRPVDIQQPQYEIVLRDEGVQDDVPLVSVSFENLVTPGEGRSQVLELVSIDGGVDQVVVTLRAIASGVVSVDINATGEVSAPDGSAPIIGTGSGSVLVVVGDE